jgi:hypothetical protein
VLEIVSRKRGCRIHFDTDQSMTSIDQAAEMPIHRLMLKLGPFGKVR